MSRFLVMPFSSIALWLSMGAAQAQVSVLQQPGTVTGSAEARVFLFAPSSGLYPTDPTTVYSVAGPAVFRFTDVVIANNNISGACLIYFMRANTGSPPTITGVTPTVATFVVPPLSTIAHSFLNGPGFAAATTLYASASNQGNYACGSSAVVVHVRGYLFTVP